MDLKEFVEVLCRRWHIVLSGLILTVIVALVAVQMVHPSYSASASLTLLAPPQTTPSGNGEIAQNPYLQFGSGIENMGTIMQEAFLDQGLTSSLQGKGATGTYDVGANGGIVTVAVSDSSASGAQKTLGLLLHQFDESLRERQLSAGADKSQLITASVLRQSKEATEDQGSRMRVLAVVLVLGFALSIAMALAVDALEPGLRRREQETEEGLSLLERDHLAEQGISGDAPPVRVRYPARDADLGADMELTESR